MKTLPRTAFKKGHIPWSKGKKVHIKHDKQFKKGMTPWNKGLTGEESHMFGRHFKMSKPAWNKGKKMNCIHPMLGKHHTEETKAKMHKPHLTMIGEHNHKWKGNMVSYSSLHKWVRRMLGKIKECVFCGSENDIEWASITHHAKRDLNDYIPLCMSCHREYDKKGRI